MKKIDVLILIALPASGKSEVRTLLNKMPKTSFPQFHDDVAQLDDYPYVEFMRAVDEAAITRLKMDPLFFHASDRGFKDPFEWVTLIELLNQDFLYSRTSRLRSFPNEAALKLFQRIDRAQRLAGARIKIGRLPEDVQHMLARQVEKEALKVEETFAKDCPPVFGGKDRSIIIEFSRGAAINAPMPLDPPFGYEFALSRLSPEILERAAVLYILVTPEQSRIKNAIRAVPPPGCTDTTTYHGVPMDVMLRDYGCDDISWLLLPENSGGHTNAIWINAHGRQYVFPTAIFDNQKDLTTFVRQPQEQWAQGDVDQIYTELKNALDKLC